MRTTVPASRCAYAAFIIGMLFLWLPIASLVLYSFNASKLVTVWTGFSTQWYAALWQERAILEAAWLSLRVGIASAFLATVLGTTLALAFARHRRFPGRTLLGWLAGAPLVMPEVLLGVSLLLLFVSLEQTIGWPGGRGVLTLVIAHATVSLAYVVVIVSSRLARLDPRLEEAALDLGAGPVTAFFTVTLPLIAPAVMAGALLAFTLSLDDLVIASFVSGPGASTLPMVVYSKVRLGLSPVVNALASLWMLGVLVLAASAMAVWKPWRAGDGAGGGYRQDAGAG
jgi:putrescine transport system permease protein